MVEEYMSRLKTKLWVSALLARAGSAGAMAVLARSGDDFRGDVLVRVLTLDGNAIIYGRAMSDSAEGEFDRLHGPGSEAEAEAITQKRIASDPDLWVIDIEDRHGRHFLTEKIRK